MKVSLYEQNLQEMRERYRVIHEQNAKLLQKSLQELGELNVKLASVDQKPKTTTVDVKV